MLPLRQVLLSMRILAVDHVALAAVLMHPAHGAKKRSYACTAQHSRPGLTILHHSMQQQQQQQQQPISQQAAERAMPCLRLKYNA